MKWEYKYVEAANPHDLLVMLKGPGEDGWELVVVMPHSYTKKKLVAYLKKPVGE